MKYYTLSKPITSLKEYKKFFNNFEGEAVIQGLDSIKMPEWLVRSHKAFTTESLEVAWYYFLAEQYVETNGVLKGTLEAIALWKEAGEAMVHEQTKKELERHIYQFTSYDWCNSESRINVGKCNWKAIYELKLKDRSKLWNGKTPQFDENGPMFSMGNFLMAAVNQSADLKTLSNTALITVTQCSRYFYETLLPWFYKTAGK